MLIYLLLLRIPLTEEIVFRDSCSKNKNKPEEGKSRILNNPYQVYTWSSKCFPESWFGGDKRGTQETARTLEDFYPSLMTPQLGWVTPSTEASLWARECSLHLSPAAERQWRAVDVVLDCFLVEEGRQRGGLASSRDMVKALLVLRQVPVLDDGSLEGFTDFQGGTLAKDNPPVTFEASGKSPPPYVPIFLGSLC